MNGSSCSSAVSVFQLCLVGCFDDLFKFVLLGVLLFGKILLILNLSCFFHLRNSFSLVLNTYDSSTMILSVA